LNIFLKDVNATEGRETGKMELFYGILSIPASLGLKKSRTWVIFTRWGVNKNRMRRFFKGVIWSFLRL